MMTDEAPGVLEFFAGRDVLVTGATGFMGKVLIEKLLRCCPDIRRIYILVRQKKGISPAARVELMTNTAVFERIRNEPDLMAKICPVEGDVGAEKLGLSPVDQLRVLEDVSVVFHMAASLNFNAPLREAVEDNTTGTQHILDFGCRMKSLVSFVYVSTAFCNCEQEFAEERVYRPRQDPHVVMKMCKELDTVTLQRMTPQLLGVHPNCYTFTKQLAEVLVEEYHTRIPLSIARPSIVIPALREPVPGWVDNLNGPTGLLIATGKGLLRSVLLNPDAYMEVIPVDICINAIIVAAYRRFMLSKEQSKNIPVYNISSNRVARWTFQELLEKSVHVMKKYPFQTILWYPSIKARTNRLVHNFVVFFGQTLPAYFVDCILVLTGRKTFMVRIQRKIVNGMQALQYFRMRDWDFRNDNLLTLWQHLNPRDKEIFFINNALPVDRDAYMRDMVLGIRQYCCHEPLDTLPQSQRLQRTLYLIHHTCVIVVYLVCGWLLLRLGKVCFSATRRLVL